MQEESTEAFCGADVDFSVDVEVVSGFVATAGWLPEHPDDRDSAAEVIGH